MMNQQYGLFPSLPAGRETKKVGSDKTYMIMGLAVFNIMKIIKKITLVLFALAMPVFLFTFSISLAANMPWLYEYGFAKYNITQVTGIERPELDKVARGLVNYWNDSEKTFNMSVIKDGQPFTIFNDREVSHLVDVKALFHLAYKALLGSFLYALVFLGLTIFLWKDRKLLAEGLMWGSGVSISLMIALGAVAVTNFTWFFTEFHLISFSNNLWQLNPATDYLIMLFPEGFWYDMVLLCFALMAVLALIIGFTGWRMMKKVTD